VLTRAVQTANCTAALMTSPPEKGMPVQLQLLGDFRFMITGRTVCVSQNGQRVLAFLALREHSVRRDQLARMLWPDITESRLLPNLRSVIWRLPMAGKEAITVSAQELKLADTVMVDLRTARSLAGRLVGHPPDISADRLTHAMRVNLRDDLLPTWSNDEWLTAERERFHQLRLHSLEILSGLLSAAGRYGAAADAALSAISADPLRESARRALVGVYLAEDNLSLAVSEFDRYRRVLRRELDCAPSRQFHELIRSAVASAKERPDLEPAAEGRMFCGQAN